MPSRLGPGRSVSSSIKFTKTESQKLMRGYSTAVRLKLAFRVACKLKPSITVTERRCHRCYYQLIGHRALDDASAGARDSYEWSTQTSRSTPRGDGPSSANTSDTTPSHKLYISTTFITSNNEFKSLGTCTPSRS